MTTDLRQRFSQGKRWVIKIGSALLTNSKGQLDPSVLARWVKQLVHLRQLGKEVVLVSSGAVAAGVSYLGWTERPRSIHGLQAAAAVGQAGLVQTYADELQQHGYRTAQVLLTHDDLSDRRRYLNARSTLLSLLSLDVIPVINENDTVITDEIRFGDNDILAALVTNLIEAQSLIILTQQPGLMTADPQVDPSAKLVPEARANDPALLEMATASTGSFGRGGMRAKISAARLAARSGAYTAILGQTVTAPINQLAAGNNIGTLLIPDQEPIDARKQWLAGHLQMKGQLVIDAGAVNALRTAGKSLLAVGIKQATGNFKRGEVVSCVDQQGNRIACGLVNYDVSEVTKILGQPSSEIETLLGYIDDDEVIHRDNMVVF